jgi:kynurenine formamidase
VLYDVPGFRGTSYVAQDQPVHGWELRDIADRQGIVPEPGDAVVVYSGRERWNEEHPKWGTERRRPGLHASCLRFLRDTDSSVLIWDMLEVKPSGYDLPQGVHAAIAAYGLALLDNADLGALVAACRETGRYEFMLVIAPLKITGATGSPVNPIAIL